MTADAYSTTEVQVERSQGEIRKLLMSHGAANFSFAEGTHRGVIWAAVEFVSADTRVRVQVPLKEPDARVVSNRLTRTRTKTKAQIIEEMVEQEARRIWRVLFHGLKARIVSVTEGVETFEQAFLAHLVDPITNQTLWEAMREPIAAGVMRAGGRGMEVGPPALGPAPLTPLRAVDDEELFSFSGPGRMGQALPTNDADIADAEVVG